MHRVKRRLSLKEFSREALHDQQIGRSIGYWMEKRGINLDELIEITGFSADRMDQLISRSFTPSLVEAYALSVVLNVGLDELINGGNTPLWRYLKSRGLQEPLSAGSTKIPVRLEDRLEFERFIQMLEPLGKISRQCGPLLWIDDETLKMYAPRFKSLVYEGNFYFFCQEYEMETAIRIRDFPKRRR